MPDNDEQHKNRILELLSYLPKEIADKAKANAEKFGLPKDFPVNGISDAINSAFIWDDSPEGDQYWDIVYTAVAKIERRISNPEDVSKLILESDLIESLKNLQG